MAIHTENIQKNTEPLSQEQEQKNENILRPKMLEDYIGQTHVKSQMKVFIHAAKARGEVLDHTLIYGPPGLGKTTLAHIIANEFGAGFAASSGPALSRAGDLATLLTSLREGHVLFIDEIHRLHTAVEEILYSAMEDYRLDIILGEGPAARSVSIPLPPFTLVGATTRTGLMSKPLFDRFGIHQYLDFYDHGALTQIVKRSALLKNVGIEEDAAFEIARRARGTPRIANRLLMRVRDFSQTHGESHITKRTATEAVSMMDVNEEGLDKMDQSLLRKIIVDFSGGPVGLGTLSASMNESQDTIEDMIEPYLIQNGYLQRTSRGRIATPKAFALLGFDPLNAHQADERSLDLFD